MDPDEARDGDAHQEHRDDELEERKAVLVPRGLQRSRPGPRCRPHAQSSRADANDPASFASHEAPVLVAAPYLWMLDHPIGGGLRGCGRVIHVASKEECFARVVLQALSSIC